MESSSKKDYSLIRFFVMTYVISWMLWIPIALSSQGIISINIPAFLGVVIGGMSPSLTAMILTLTREGKAGIRDLFIRLLPWRIAVHWYLFALCAPAALMICATIFHGLLQNASLEIPKIGSWTGVAVLFLFTLVLGGPLGEEVGWRGYVLPRLLISRNAFSASLIVGAFWGAWHLPLFWMRGSLQADIPIAWFMISILAESILYTWVYMHTKGSLLPIILFHTAINTWAKIILFPLLDNSLRPLLLTFGLEIILAIVLVVLAGKKFLSSPEAR